MIHGIAEILLSVGQTGWQPALDRVGRLFSSNGVIVLALPDGAGPPLCTSDLRDGYKQYLTEGWFRRDPRARAIPLMMRGVVATDLDVVSQEEITRSPYYQEFQRFHDGQCFMGLVVGQGADQWCFAFQRSARVGHYNDEERKTIERFRPILRQSIETARMVSEIRNRGLLEGLSLSGRHGFLIGRTGDVLSCTSGADRLPGLTLKRQRIKLADPAADEALSARISASVNYALASALPTDTIMVRDGGTIRVGLKVVSLIGTESYSDFDGARAVVLAKAFEPTLPDSLQALFRLSGAELALAKLLVAGHSLQEIAELRSVSIGTVRGQMKSLFAKTHTDRQGALVGLLARLDL